MIGVPFDQVRPQLEAEAAARAQAEAVARAAEAEQAYWKGVPEAPAHVPETERLQWRESERKRIRDKEEAAIGRNLQIREVREVIKGIAERNAPQFEEWLLSIAKDDPYKAATLFLSMIEYHIPKLARSEVNANMNHQNLASVLASIGKAPPLPNAITGPANDPPLA